MQKGHSLQFDCISCNHPIHFSIFQLENSKAPLCCHFCERQYFLEDSTLCRQLKKFEALCRQIVESEEILGTASIGIDIEEHQVKIPYKLLLTRFNSCIELMIGDQPITIVFRLEPAIDLPYPINR